MTKPDHCAIHDDRDPSGKCSCSEILARLRIEHGKLQEKIASINLNEAEAKIIEQRFSAQPVCRFCGRGIGFGHTMCGPCSEVP